MSRTIHTLLLITMLAGCASELPNIQGRQYLPVSATQKPFSVALSLTGYTQCNALEDCETDGAVLLELQQAFETCIARGLQDITPQAELLGRDDWHRHPGIENGIASLVGSSSQGGADTAAPYSGDFPVAWVIALEAEHSTSERRGTFDIQGQDGVIMMAVGQEWTKTSRIKARIWSARQGALAGELSAEHSQDGFWALPTLYVIPLIPFGWSPDVEGKSCRELGRGLGRFFTGVGNDYFQSDTDKRVSAALSNPGD